MNSNQFTEGKSDPVEVLGKQPLSCPPLLSSKTDSIKSHIFICSSCKLEFKTEIEYDTHVKITHNELLSDDIKALKKTSELSALLEATINQNPELLESIVEPDIMLTSVDQEKKQMDNSEEVKVTIKDKAKVHQEIVENIQVKQTKIDLKCNQCDFTPDTERDLRIRKKNDHELLLSCNQCMTKTRTQYQLKTHKQESHYMNIKCEKCDFKAKNTANLKIHILKKNFKMENFQCNECDKKFTTQWLLTLHKKKHIPAFKCEHCKFKGITLKTLQVHKLQTHIPNSFSHIGLKRDHTMIPKNSPPKKFKKIETQYNTPKKVLLPKVTQDVVGGAGWSLAGKENKTNTLFEVPAQNCKQCEYKAQTKTEMKNHQKDRHEVSLSMDWQRKGIVELPHQVKEINEYKDCLRQKVIGNGACGPNCAATHVWLDGRRGTEFSRDLNTHIGIHSGEYMDHISFPRTVILGNGLSNEHFKDRVEDREMFVHFLVADPDAAYMWRESLDLQAMSNMSNMPIDIVKVDQYGNVIYIQKYFPNTNFKWIDKERPTMPKEKMTLINQNDHFDLIIQKASALAQDGTLEYQEIVAQNPPKATYKTKEAEKEPTESFKCDYCDTNMITKNALEEHATKFHVHEIIKMLQSEVIALKGENKTLKEKVLEKNYKTQCNVCGQEFQSKTDLKEHKQNDHEHRSINNEWTTVKSTVQTEKSNQIINTKTNNIFSFANIHNCEICGQVFNTVEKMLEHIEYHKKDTHSVNIQPDEVDKCNDTMSVINTSQQEDIQYICRVCKVDRHSKEMLEKHMSNHIQEGDWYCEICYFQTNNIESLKTHLRNSKSCREGHIKELGNKFNILQGEEVKCNFCESYFGSNKQMSRHRKDVHPTHKPCRNLERCEFSESCYFSHSPIPDGWFRCFQCGNDFQTRNAMMIHRKNEHDGVKICRKFISNQCERSLNCWWKHEDFQQAPPPSAPPGPLVTWPRLNPTPGPTAATATWPATTRKPTTEVTNKKVKQQQDQIPNQVTLMMKTMEANINIMRNIIEITMNQQ